MEMPPTTSVSQCVTCSILCSMLSFGEIIEDVIQPYVCIKAPVCLMVVSGGLMK